MPRKSNKRSNKRRRTRKQKPIVMVGCSKRNRKSCKNKKVFSSCPKCGPNCHCGPNCKCAHPCPGSCYLNRRFKGGSGCGSCGCPLSPMSWSQMNKYGGGYASYPNVLNRPVLQGDGSILGVGQNGGTCSACSQIPVQSGGSFYKPSAPIPGPFVGSSWSADKLPGTNGVGSDRNYLDSYSKVIGNDPQLQMSMNNSGYRTLNSMVGGYTYNKKSNSSSVSSKKGGGLVPQDLVNLGRDFTYNLKSAYNTLNGYNSPVDPAPYKGQLTGALSNKYV